MSNNSLDSLSNKWLDSLSKNSMDIIRLAGLVMLLDGLVLASVFALVVLGLFVVMGLIV